MVSHQTVCVVFICLVDRQRAVDDIQRVQQQERITQSHREVQCNLCKLTTLGTRQSGPLREVVNLRRFNLLIK